MNVNKSALACALACAVVSGQVLAHAPSVTPQVSVFMAGTVAAQKWLGHFASAHCQSGTLDVYYDTATNGATHRAYFCTATGTGTTVDGQKVFFNDNGQLDSNGVFPVVRGLAIPNMTVSTTSCGAAAVGTDAETGAPLWKCANTVNAVPDAGVTDVEPAMFVGINKDSSSVADFNYNRVEAGKLSGPYSMLAWVLGIPVTNDLGLTNLSRDQVLSIFSGTYTDWSQVSPGLSGQITICRGVTGSGAQAGINAFFMNYPCGLANGGGLNPLDGNGNPSVIMNVTVSDMKNCLNTHSHAIGLLGADTQPGFGTDSWSFVSINHEVPTVENAAVGNYDYTVEQTMQWRTVAVNGAPAVSAAQQALLSAMQSMGGDPAYLGAQAGVAALWSNGYTPTIPFNAAYPVMYASRFSNTCTPNQLAFP